MSENQLPEDVINKVLETLFPRLKGINFKNVHFVKNSLTDIIDSQNENNDWKFSVDTEPFLYKIISFSNLGNEINSIKQHNSLVADKKSDDTLIGNGFIIISKELNNGNYLLSIKKNDSNMADQSSQEIDSAYIKEISKKLGDYKDLTNEVNDIDDDVRVETDSEKGIHPKSKYINSCVDGLNSDIYYNKTKEKLVGTFVADLDNPTIIESYFKFPDEVIKIFKNIVSHYNENDDFLLISNNDIIELFKKYPKEKITFSLEHRFGLEMCREKTFLKLNIIPPGGIYGSWDEFDDSEPIVFPPSVDFSQLREKIKIEDVSDDEIDYEEEKKNFFEEAVDDNYKKDNKSANQSGSNLFRNFIIAIIALLILSFLWKACNTELNYFERSKYHFEKGNFKKGIKYIDKYIVKYPNEYEVLLYRGIQLFNNEKYYEAEIDFETLTKNYPNEWEAYFWLARSQMEQAFGKYSPKYKSAIQNFTTSLKLESSSVNSKSYFFRGECKDISLGQGRGCSDYVDACELGLIDACERYNNQCYPQTGFMPYEKYFGKGISSGTNKLTFDNSKCSIDKLILIVNQNKIKVRCQFVREGELLIMDNVPNGIYEVKVYSGSSWVFDELMDDGITRGGFKSNQVIERFKRTFEVNDIFNTFTGIDFCAEFGDLKSDDISINDFMK